MQNLKPILNNILFKFVEDTSSSGFVNKTSWGFEVIKRTDDPKFPRWGRVENVGPDAENINIGDYILIQPLMWTLKMKFENDEFWATNSDKVIATSKTAPII